MGTVLRRLEPNLLGGLAQDDVGIERKTVKGLALNLGKREVGNLRRAEVSFSVPKDTLFNLSKLKSIMEAREK